MKLMFSYFHTIDVSGLDNFNILFLFFPARKKIDNTSLLFCSFVFFLNLI